MGQHLRFETSKGPVHVYVPDNYSGGGTVLYVHGYYDTVDSAWAKQQLMSQFDASRRNAVFIVPEAPQKSGDPVVWKDLNELLDIVALKAGVRPADPIVAVGHSAGFETIAAWLGNPRLVNITLLDALYGFVDAFVKWANQLGHTLNLIVTSSGKPRTNAESILHRLAGLVQRSGVTAAAVETSAKTLFIIATQSHMKLVEPQPGAVSNWVMPTLLRRSPISAIGSLPGGVVAAVAIGVGFAAWFWKGA